MTKRMKAEDFVGWKSDDGKLEVIGIHSNLESGRAVYNVLCHICCKDSELFGDGVFQSLKSNLVKQKKPCGCSSAPKWTQDQYSVRIKREIEGKYIFMGFIGDVKDNESKLKLLCCDCNHEWNASIAKVMSGRGCPECKKQKIGKALYKAESFVGWKSEDGFLEVVSVFEKQPKNTVFNVICHKCKLDPELFGSAMYKSVKTSLLLGVKPCGCSQITKWTKEQWEIRANRSTKNEFTVNGFASEYMGARSKMNLTCNTCNCKWVSSLDNITRFKSRCPDCTNKKLRMTSPAYGFYVTRTTEQDNLYVLNFNNEYIKVGRAFDISKRVDRLKK